ALTFLSWILCLFKRRTFRGETILFFVLCVIACLLHGSKSQVTLLAFIWLLHRVYVGRRRMSLSTALILAVVLIIGIRSLFYVLSPVRGETERTLEDSLKGLSAYSDYTRNAMMVIDDEPDRQYGRLTLEQTVYSRVPRILFPSKPKDWGPYWLAKKYYPFWFEKEIGHPSFGIIGVPYADFGYFAMPYLLGWFVITAILLKLFAVRLRHSRSPSDFIMLVFLSGIVVIPSGVGYTLPEHFVLAVVVALMLRVRFVFSGSSAVAEVQPAPMRG
ncbi:MAG: hypothetical protein AB1744_15065, partial [Candidatus Zixiibacteriota bacterium]